MLGSNSAAQRQYLYSNIQQEIEGLFDLVLKIHQSSALADLPNHQGCCRGFAEYWEQYLLPQDPSCLQTKYPEYLPINPTILKLQRAQGIQLQLTKSLWSRQFDATEPSAHGCEQMLNYMTTKLIAPYQQPHTLQVFAIGKTSRRQLSCTLPVFYSSLRLPTKWHEVRLYHDGNGYMHWFDANVGWFKSVKPFPSLDIIAKFLEKLFNFMQYQDYTTCVACARYSKQIISSNKQQLTLS